MDLKNNKDRAYIIYAVANDEVTVESLGELVEDDYSPEKCKEVFENLKARLKVLNEARYIVFDCKYIREGSTKCKLAFITW